MANQFVARKGLIAQADSIISGSLNISGSVNVPFGSSHGYKINTNRVLSQTSGVFEFGALDYKSAYPNIAIQNDNTFRVLSNGSTLLYVTGSGNVGIGTTTPQVKLHVAGRIRTTYDGNTAWYGGNFVRLFNSQEFTFLNSAGSSIAAINLNGNSYFNGGNVGIGTTSPSAKLHVSGTISGSRIYAAGTSEQHKLFSSATGGIVEIKPSDTRTGIQPVIVYRSNVTGTANYLMAEGATTWFATYDNGIPSDKSGMIGITPNNVDESPSLVIGDAGSNDAQLRISDNIRLSSTGSLSSYINAGNVGIGTTSPSYKLHITDNTNSSHRLYVENQGAGQSSLDLKQSTNHIRIIADSAHPFRLYDQNNAAERFTLTTSGNVGIGTTNPSQVLEVRDGNLVVSSSNSKVAVGTATGVPRIYSNANEDLFLATANQSGSVVYLQDSNGYVGIGTSSPTKELTVAGAVSASTYFGDASNLTGVTTSDGLADILENDNSAGPYDLDMNTNNILGVTEIQADVFNGLSASLSYITASGDLFIDTNVGIGTTNPSEKLTVQDGSITSKDASGTNYAKLDRFSGLTLKGNGAGSRGVQTPNTDDLTLGTNNTERVRITSGGNVGIGTTSPSQKLEVRDGTLLISGSSGGEWIRLERSSGRTWAISRDDQTTNKDFSIEDVTAGTRPLLIAGLTGNIGIGNDKPSQKLTVQGNISASGDLYLGNNSTINFNTTTGTVGKIVGGSDLSFYSDNLIKFVESDDNIIRLVAGTNSGTFNINTTGEYNSAIKLYVNGDSRFNGDGTFTGDLTVSGIVTAQEFHTEFVSASIIYSSGSTKFGDSNDDIHQFTGSLEVNSTEPQILIKNPVSGTGNAVLKFEEGSGVTQNATITFNQGGQNNLTIATGYQSSNDENRIYLAPAGNIGLTVRGGTGTNDGNVGIGTTTPINRLQVITDNNAGKWRVGDYGGMYFANNSDTGHEVYLHGRSDGSLSIGRISGSNLTGGEGGYASTAYDNMYISSSGNVGIGTTTPTRELTVNGDIGVKNGGRLYLWDSHNNNYLQYDKWTTSASSGMTITNQASTGDLSLQTVSTTRLFISASGNVGIGTTSPSELLHVDGDTKVTNLGVNAGPQDYLSSLSARLVVGGNIVVNNNNPLIYLRSNSSGNDSDIRYQTALKFTNGSGTTHAYINSSGNVGIGTTSPSQKLEVRDGNLIVSSSTSEVVIGTASGKPRMQSNGNQDLLFSTPSYTNLVYLQESTGNVGIGTTSPNTKLTVEGAVSASGGFYGSGANLTGITTSDGLADILENDNSAGGFNLDMNDNDILGVDEIAVNIVNGISASLSYITASGDLFIDTGVGIGTQPNPTAALQVEGIISGSKIDLKRGGYITFYGDDDGTGDHAITSRDANGNPSDDLRINSFHNVYVNLDSNNNNTSTSTSFSISQHGGTGTLGSAVFSVRGDGLTTVTGDLSVTGNTYATASWATNLVNIPDLTTVLTAGNGGGGLSITEVNDITATGTVEAGSFIETSARRFKENIEPIEGALDIVSNIDGVTFNRIGEERREYGFIADEIESTAPELVSYDDTGQVHGVHYARTVAVLTEAVKELNDKVKAQDLFIKDLVARIEKLENN